jgi:hypothetical protein
MGRGYAFFFIVLGSLALWRGVALKTPPKYECTDAVLLMRWYIRYGLILGGEVVRRNRARHLGQFSALKTSKARSIRTEFA